MAMWSYGGEVGVSAGPGSECNGSEGRDLDKGGRMPPPPLNEARAFDRSCDSVLENATFHAVIDFILPRQI